MVGDHRALRHHRVNRGVEILVKNLAYDKKVWLTTSKDGSRKDVPATSSSPRARVRAPDRLYQLHLPLPARYAYGTMFCLKYEVGGSTYGTTTGR
jgi:hypothetical protein